LHSYNGDLDGENREVYREESHFERQGIKQEQALFTDKQSTF